MVDADIQSLATLPETMDTLYLRGEWGDVRAAFPLLSRVRALCRLSLDYSGVQWLETPEVLADALHHLGLQELAFLGHWEVWTLQSEEGYESWIACL